MKENQNPELANNEFFETLISLAQQSLSQPQPRPSICINQSRNFNHIKVDVHVTTQPQPGLLRRIFAKFF